MDSTSNSSEDTIDSHHTKFNGTFVKAIVPLQDESENRAITAWLYKDEVPIDLIEQAREITPKKYGLGLRLMKHYGCKGVDPIGCNNNGLIDPLKATTRSNKKWIQGLDEFNM